MSLGGSVGTFQLESAASRIVWDTVGYCVGGMCCASQGRSPVFANLSRAVVDFADRVCSPMVPLLASSGGGYLSSLVDRQLDKYGWEGFTT